MKRRFHLLVYVDLKGTSEVVVVLPPSEPLPTFTVERLQLRTSLLHEGRRGVVGCEGRFSFSRGTRKHKAVRRQAMNSVCSRFSSCGVVPRVRQPSACYNCLGESRLRAYLRGIVGRIDPNWCHAERPGSPDHYNVIIIYRYIYIYIEMNLIYFNISYTCRKLTQA